MSDTPTLRVLSLGAGVQSTTLALLAAEGTLPGLDAAIFADTLMEPWELYGHLSGVERDLRNAGIDTYRVSAGHLWNDLLNPDARYGSIPYYIRNPDGSDGMGRRQCTSFYKVEPIKKKVRELLGYPHPAPVPKGVWAEQWIGFSTDEVHRVRSKLDVRYSRPRHPLLELGMSRTDCETYLRDRGRETAKSACILCPYHGNRHWRETRDQRPWEWRVAVVADRTIRRGGRHGEPLRGEAFLHRSRVPLDEAPIDRLTKQEWLKANQYDLF